MRLLLSIVTLCLVAAPVCGFSQTEESAAEPSPASDRDTAIEEMDREIGRMIEKDFAPTGPAVRNWSEQGIDLAALLAMHPGSALASTDKEAPSVYIAGADPDKLLPQAWHRVKSSGTGELSGPAEEIVLIAFTPHHVVATRSHARKIGKANCSVSRGSFELIYFERDGPMPDEHAEFGAGMTFFLDRYLTRLNEIELCTVLLPKATGRYRFRYFTPAGRPLGKMDDDESDSILIPEAQIPDVLKLAR